MASKQSCRDEQQPDHHPRSKQRQRSGLLASGSKPHRDARVGVRKALDRIPLIHVTLLSLVIVAVPTVILILTLFSAL